MRSIALVSLMLLAVFVMAGCRSMDKLGWSFTPYANYQVNQGGHDQAVFGASFTIFQGQPAVPAVPNVYAPETDIYVNGSSAVASASSRTSQSQGQTQRQNQDQTQDQTQDTFIPPGQANR